MKKRIGTKMYDTDKAVNIGCKYFGKFGEPNGYEEQLYVTANAGQHFIYGIGGSESKYSSATITLITGEQAKEWKNSAPKPHLTADDKAK